MPPSEPQTTRTTSKTAPQEAFLASGLSHAEVARRVSVSEGYLKNTLLRNGAKTYHTAERLRLVLGCRVEVFLPRPPRTAQPATKRAQSKSNKSESKIQTKEGGRVGGR